MSMQSKVFSTTYPQDQQLHTSSKFNADGGYYHSHLLLAHSEGCTIYVYLLKTEILLPSQIDE